MSAGAKPSSVAALLPAWRAADFIQATLDSLAAQTYANLQVIVSVDLCDDATYDLCAAQAVKDPRFRVVRQERRLGYVGNCNFLLGEAEADYALFAFHDDLLAPAYVERVAATLDTHPEAILAFSDLTTTDVDGKEEHWAFTALEGEASRLRRGRRMLRPVPKWWVPNRGLFRLSAARAINGLKTHGAGEFSADWPWLFHMSLLGGFVRVPETLCFKHYKTGSLSRSWEFSDRQLYEARAACLRELWNSPLQAVEKATLAAPVTRWMADHPPEATT